MTDNTTYIVAAFALTWAGLLAYAWHLRQARREATRRWREAQTDLSGRDA